MSVLIADDSDLILERLHKMLNMDSKVEIAGLYKNVIGTPFEKRLPGNLTVPRLKSFI